MNNFFFNITKEVELKKDSKGKLNNLEDILFVSSSKLSNYADHNTLYASGYNIEEVKEVLLNDLNKVAE